LILIDPFTPNLSGREFRQAQLLDRRLARVPVLVLAGPDMRADFPGDVGFIPTPTDHTELLRAVEQFAQQRRPEILVVEDQPDVLLMLEKALTYYGFVPRLASGGQVALEVYRRHRDSIDLAMIDVQMAPLDGPQTLAALRQIHPQVRAAFMSGHAGTFTTEDLLAMGAALVFIKPFELGSLAEDLWQLLQGPQVAGAAVAQPA
jgi:two-component system OmpR family response regulator